MTDSKTANSIRPNVPGPQPCSPQTRERSAGAHRKIVGWAMICEPANLSFGSQTTGHLARTFPYTETPLKPPLEPASEPVRTEAILSMYVRF